MEVLLGVGWLGDAPRRQGVGRGEPGWEGAQGGVVGVCSGRGS